MPCYFLLSFWGHPTPHLGPRPNFSRRGVFFLPTGGIFFSRAPHFFLPRGGPFFCDHHLGWRFKLPPTWRFKAKKKDSLSAALICIFRLINPAVPNREHHLESCKSGGCRIHVMHGSCIHVNVYKSEPIAEHELQ